MREAKHLLYSVSKLDKDVKNFNKSSHNFVIFAWTTLVVLGGIILFA